MADRIKIRGYTATVTESARGYVQVHARGREPITVVMHPDVKDRVCALAGDEHVQAWRREMQALRTFAIERARREWR
jgi:hypothetical protein